MSKVTDSVGNSAAHIKAAVSFLQNALNGASSVEAVVILLLIKRATTLARDIEALRIAIIEDL